MTASQHDELLEGLTQPQREAVTHVDGPLCVLAGPGSGKTRVITRRVAYLVRCVGIAPWNVLAITFTNKAAGEMRERVASLVSERQARAITVCTFHSLCARILRTYGERLHLPPNFSIYDTDDQQRAMKQAVKDLDMNTSNFPPGRVLATISHAKNELQDPAAFALGAADFYSRNVAKLYKQYQSILKKNHALDFDDLLLNTVDLLRNHRDACDQLRERFQYVLIDEYQDTNHAQFVIANTIASGVEGPGAKGQGQGANEESAMDESDSDPLALGLSPMALRRNICATGDPDQSIYRWRGADIRNILEFEEHYPDAKVVRLEQNYRSTKRILAVADSLIQRNKHRKHKTLWTENDEGEKVNILVCQDEQHEAQWIASEFKRRHDDEGMEWRDMAVFYRINSLSRVIEDALRNNSIPYQIARGTAFFDRKEVKDALAYLRAAANPADEVSLLRIINTPARGISDNTVKALQAHAVAHDVTVFDLLRRANDVAAINARAVTACQKFGAMLHGWRKAAGFEDDNPRLPPGAMFPANPQSAIRNPQSSLSFRAFVDQILRESGLHEMLAADASDPDGERLANLGELVSSAQQFEDDFEGIASLRFTPDGSTLAQEPTRNAPLHEKLSAYLEQVSLVSDVDSVNAANGAVTLMTLHAAKGLEYPVVAMLAVEDGLLPHQRGFESEHELEEERRLCFVGITRSKRHLYLSHARYRTVFGQTQPTIPSRFLQEMPAEHVQKIRADEAFDYDDSDIDPLAAARGFEYEVGDRVRHPKFGVGRIVSVKGHGAQTRAQVQFNSFGLKTLILEFANLERV